MPKIIAEIHKLDRYLTINQEYVIQNDSTRYFESLFNKHGYSTKDYERSVEYYLTRPTKLKKIYSQALHILEEEEKEIDNLIKIRAKEDSIKGIVKLFKEESLTLTRVKSKRRSIRWLLYPQLHPHFRYAIGDSLRDLYETPHMREWWINNVKIDTTKFLIFKKDEKNSRPLHISSKRKITNTNGSDNPK